MEKIETARLCAGDNTAWTQLYSEYRSCIIEHTVKCTGFKREDAEDAFQNAMVELFIQASGKPLTVPDDRLFCFVLDIYVKRLIDIGRSEKAMQGRHGRLQYEAIAEYENPWDKDNVTETRRARVQSMLPLLQERDRRLYKLCAGGKHGMGEIAEKMHLNNANTASKGREGMIKKLQKLLEAHGLFYEDR
jgi:DNA-directed RNA polymerase specialized sigma24 family protein